MRHMKIFVVLKKNMQQIAYIVLYIILLDEYKVLISYKCFYLELNSQRPLRTLISCIFFNLKGLVRRTLTELFFECRHRNALTDLFLYFQINYSSFFAEILSCSFYQINSECDVYLAVDQSLVYGSVATLICFYYFSV